jgi:hypothetical protein
MDPTLRRTPLRRLRLHLAAALLLPAAIGFALPASAQSDQRPPNLQPVPEPPPLPPGAEPDPSLEPAIRIVKPGDRVEVFRQGPATYLRVTPAGGGRPYFLVDYRGDGKFTRQDNLDSGFRVPMWEVFSF